MANDTQGVTGLNGKLVTQPNLPSSGASSLEEPFRQVIQAPAPGSTTTDRNTMNLVDQAKLPGYSGQHSHAVPTKGSKG